MIREDDLKVASVEQFTDCSQFITNKYDDNIEKNLLFGY